MRCGDYIAHFRHLSAARGVALLAKRIRMASAQAGRSRGTGGRWLALLPLGVLATLGCARQEPAPAGAPTTRQLTIADALIPAGGAWKYWDKGSEPAAAAGLR